MDQSIDMTIGSDLKEIPAVSERLEGALAAYGFSPESILDTQLAVEEVITNVIMHGYKGPGGEIRISCRFARDDAEIRITDTAPPFNPLTLPEPDLGGDLGDRKIGGLGVYLVRQVMDEVRYRREDTRNILTLIKKKNPDRAVSLRG
ncbi:MAG TPA: ATP-binding protein [Methanoregula sp.]|nr:ATP-binding protein [Methanoregula sp.]